MACDGDDDDFLFFSYCMYVKEAMDKRWIRINEMGQYWQSFLPRVEIIKFIFKTYFVS